MGSIKQFIKFSILIMPVFAEYLCFCPYAEASRNLDVLLLEKLKNNAVIKESQRQKRIDLSRKLIKSKSIEQERMLYARAENDLLKQSKLIEQMLYNYSPVDFHLKTGFINPVGGKITCGFGLRIHPVFRIESFHTGIDISGQNLAPVHAANYGKIISTGWRGGYGNTVIINHGIYKGRNTSTLYGHMAQIFVTNNQIVKKGQVIGLEGSTGTSTAHHLHFEIRENGIPINPLQLLN